MGGVQQRPTAARGAAKGRFGMTDALVVGVVGAGTMGAGIAQLALTAGHEVILYDVDDSAIGRARSRIGDGLERLAAKGRLDATGPAAALARLRDATELDALGAEADIVVEAALEDIGLKRDIFRALDSAASGPAVLATNTSALSVSAIAEGAIQHPERVVGLHFFNPAPLMALVEVVSGERSDASSLDRAEAFARGLGKTTVRCHDAPGFIVNRVNRPFTLEALRMIESGEATVTAVDDAIIATGFPMGPFALMDLVGIDVNYAVARTLWEAFDHAARFQPSPIQEILVAADHLGRKSGEGFYRYGSDGKPIGPADDFGDASAPGAPRPDAIVERITLAIVNEAYHALGEGVASRSDIDLALKLGANHPWGPFERVTAFGGAERVGVRLRALERRFGKRFAAAPGLREDAPAGT
jgi:3-hydroxybutyryl-CoA dehydrogenase